MAASPFWVTGPLLGGASSPGAFSGVPSSGLSGNPLALPLGVPALPEAFGGGFFVIWGTSWDCDLQGTGPLQTVP